MFNSTMRTSRGRLLVAAIGVIIMSIGINVFTAPLDLYTSGLMGYAQVLRTVLDQYLGIRVTSIDLAGVFYYMINIPILLLTTRSLGKLFALRTVAYTTLFSLATAFIPVPAVPVVDDPLTNIILGAICVGVGDGLVLTCGCSVGGIDMLGLYFSKKIGTPVGMFGTYANIALFLACFFLFDFSIVLYSLIYMVFTNMLVDKMHQQNINLQVFIFTKHMEGKIQRRIMEETCRGVTCWDGSGAYTGEANRVLCICINRYEREKIERIAKEVDPYAFIIAIPGVYINGNFVRKVDA